jgi:BlaI family penicillinase repressor
MKDIKMTDAEYRLADIIWDSEPIGSPELCKLCEARLGWKRTTTYTVLKKLCVKGIMRNDAAVVTSIVPRESAQKSESRAVMEKAFNGSLPLFVSSFLSGKMLSAEEARQLKELIDRHKEE